MGHPFAVITELERALGEAGEVFSHAGAVERDGRDEFPTEACRELDRLRVHDYYVPAALGGRLTGAEDLLQVIRTLARRDLTLAIAHAKTYLGAVAVWLAADPGQAAWLAGEVRAGAVVSLGVTEREHGSDLLAGEVEAVPDGDGYRVTGEKWLINNATRADLVCVLARTDPAGGPRGFSLLLVDKRRLAPGEYSCLPKELTYGVRGADISGIALHGARVPGTALVGRPGAGLEIALGGFQVTRTLCAGMSLGLLDTALRVATGFALRHTMYGRRLVDLPRAGRTLAAAYADLLLVEATGLLAARAIHLLPGELSVCSAAVKYLVPTVGDRAIADLAGLLGARALLVRDHAAGVFQKVTRDHRIVGIFDGNTLVNLTAIVNQFPVLARAYQRGRADLAAVRAAASVGGPLPELDPGRLALLSRDGCAVVQALPAVVAELAERVPAGLAARLRRLLALTDGIHEEMAAVRRTSRDVPTAAFRLAQRYAWCFAAAACVHVWREGEWPDGRWLTACLDRVLGRLDPAGGTGGATLDDLLPDLLAAHQDGALLSLFRCPVGVPR